MVAAFPVDALKGPPGDLLHEFYLATAPYITELSCFETHASLRMKREGGWSLPLLKKLDLGGTMLQDDDLAAFDCPQLELLNLERATRISLVALKRFVQAEVLIHKCPQLREEGRIRSRKCEVIDCGNSLLEEVENVSKLKLVKCGEKVDSVLKKCAHLPGISHLSIYDFAVEDVCVFQAIKGSFPQIRSLSLRGPISLLSLVNSIALENVTKLTLKCAGSQESLRQIEDITTLRDLRGLEYLRLEGFSELTTQGMRGLVQGSQRLRQLHLRNCPNAHVLKLSHPGLALLQIEVRKTFDADRVVHQAQLDEELERLQVLEDAPGMGIEGRACYEELIASTKRKLDDLAVTKGMIEAAFQKEKAELVAKRKAFDDELLSEPVIGRYQTLLDEQKMLHEKAAANCEVILRSMMDIEAEQEQLAFLSAEYEQALRIAADTKKRMGEIEEEQRHLSEKSVAVVLSANKKHHFLPFEKKLEKCGLLPSLLNRIKEFSEEKEPLELTLLFTPEEIEPLFALNILSKPHVGPA